MARCCFNFHMKKIHHFHCQTFFHKGKAVLTELVHLCKGQMSWETQITTAWNCISQFSPKTNWLRLHSVLVQLDRLRLSGNRKSMLWDCKAALVFLGGFISCMYSLQSSDLRRLGGWQGEEYSPAIRSSHLLVYWLWKKVRGLSEMFLVSVMTMMSLEVPWKRQLAGEMEHLEFRVNFCSAVFFPNFYL